VTTAYSVLVVENDQSVGGLLQELLEDEGYKVERAADGQHALASIQTHAPDAVLLDVRIPKLDGVQVLNSVRASELDNRSHLPIILMSGAATEAERETALAAGADDYLSKPFDLDALLDRVTHLLERRDLNPKEWDSLVSADGGSSAV
jgi:DNA-binding response OmpR family regulator